MKSIGNLALPSQVIYRHEIILVREKLIQGEIRMLKKYTRKILARATDAVKKTLGYK